MDMSETVENLRLKLDCELAAWASEHTAMQKLCLKAGFSKEKVEGDDMGVPDIVDLANMLAQRISVLEMKLLYIQERLNSGWVLSRFPELANVDLLSDNYVEGISMRRAAE